MKTEELKKIAEEALEVGRFGQIGINRNPVTYSTIVHRPIRLTSRDYTQVGRGIGRGNDIRVHVRR